MRSGKCHPDSRNMIVAGGLVLALSLPVSGCEPARPPGTISQETFVEYCTVFLRAQEDAAGDRESLLRALEAAPMPSNWREEMVDFAEKNHLTAVEWSDLISQAITQAEEPTDR
ncbi:MAG: hypothetical protein KAW17_06365 [Candidatus Eisenbacteria sp.]|nr:hypothetical protein [Candidatus Eisenbacteria bacterium]